VPGKATIEERLAVEAVITELRAHRVTQPPAPDWLEQVVGSFQNEPAFEELLAYGRAIRKGELAVEDVDPWWNQPPSLLMFKSIPLITGKACPSFNPKSSQSSSTERSSRSQFLSRSAKAITPGQPGIEPE
jgi:hypothetical protein